FSSRRRHTRFSRDWSSDVCSSDLPPPATTTAEPPPPTTTTPSGPRQVTYSVTGTKAPGDIISVTYVDASGRRRTQRNVYIPWSRSEERRVGKGSGGQWRPHP